MNYRPRLVFQSYSAYTPLLLKENAAHLTGRVAPDFIFYGYQSLDNRIPAAIDSSALLNLLTRYRPVRGKKMLRRTDTEQKTLLLHEIASFSAGFGQVVNVPSGPPFVCLSLNMRNSLPGKFLKYAVRPAAVEIQLFLDNGKTITHKLIPEIADVPFLLSPYLKDWAKLELLFEPGVPQLPRIVAFSVSPSVHCFSHYFPKLADYDRELGKWAFGKDIQIHFYAFQPDPNENPGRIEMNDDTSGEIRRRNG